MHVPQFFDLQFCRRVACNLFYANLSTIFVSQTSLTLFSHSNAHAKAKHSAPELGQLVTHYSCDALPTAPQSHSHAVETLFYRFT